MSSKNNYRWLYIYRCCCADGISSIADLVFLRIWMWMNILYIEEAYFPVFICIQLTRDTEVTRSSQVAHILLSSCRVLQLQPLRNLFPSEGSENMAALGQGFGRSDEAQAVDALSFCEVNHSSPSPNCKKGESQQLPSLEKKFYGNSRSQNNPSKKTTGKKEKKTGAGIQQLYITLS